MRIALLQLALLLIAAPAWAVEPFHMLSIRGELPIVVGDHTARIATSEAGYLDLLVQTGSNRTFRASDSVSVATLFAELTNGVDDGLTFTNPNGSVVVSEGDWIDFGYNHLFAGPDLIGAQLDHLQMSFVRLPLSGTIRYSMSAWGNLPEPSSAALFVLGGCVLHITRGCRWRRSSRTH